MGCDRCPWRCTEKPRCGVVDAGGPADRYPWRIAALTLGLVDDIPLYHYHPGSLAIKMWVPGYTYECSYCEWAPLATSPRNLELREISCRDIAGRIRRTGARMVVITGPEPLIQDWTLEACTCLKEMGISCGFTSSSYVSTKRVSKAASQADFMVFYVPGEPPRGVDPGVFVDAVEEAQSHDIVVEVSIYYTGSHKSRLVLDSIVYTLKRDIPLHLLPAQGHAFTAREAEKLYLRLKALGLDYVYIHGDPLDRYTSTRCPRCGAILIERVENRARVSALDRGATCPKCGYKLRIVGGSGIRPPKIPWLGDVPLK